MSEKTTTLDTLKKIPKWYDRIWFIVIALAAGLLIMNAVNGNLVRQNTDIAREQIKCPQTSPENVENLDTTELKTVYVLTKVNDEEIFQSKYGKNSIPSISNPKFGSIDEIKDCIPKGSEVLVVTHNGVTKIYPSIILAQHLAINDEFSDESVLITNCILCNSPRVYISKINAEELEFGLSGLLYKNNDLLFDKKSESLWSQFTGEALVGEQIGNKLREIPHELMTIEEAADLYPNAKVLNFETGFVRNYADQSYLSFERTEDTVAPVTNRSARLPMKEKVLGLNINETNYALPQKYAIDYKTEIEGKLFEVVYENGFKATYDDEGVNLYPSYWYVWFDFYPDTTILEDSSQSNDSMI